MYYVFLADGFEETEALATVDVMRRAKLEVLTVGVTGEMVTGSHKIAVKADISTDSVDLSKAQGVVLPGGVPGTPNLENSKAVIECVKYCYDNSKIVAAICAAPSILGHMGLLKDKKATCYPDYRDELDCAEYTAQPVTVDGNIITARGAGCSVAFGHAIVQKVISKEAADNVCKAMQCQ